ncbi:hypothetical protein Vafri_9027 [Volvox africanus]|uniref:protein-L-isoaspartate(D-aspartate) O-methyltransferase n=1 Tax=Volvox africanus TaxID=51714 RepID=A0A8J4B851_9CHLO|nr:hypothetical protein Vafri_9027 [Volvox africanus]
MANPNAEQDEGIPLDPDSDNDDDPGVPLQGQPRRERLERIALFDFLRLLAGNREPQPGFTTMEELVNHLKSNDTITSDAVSRAMLACPRDLFVPYPHRVEALADRPIRVEAAGFNISAPHVQAVSLQALALEQGQRVLDVGCGCGIITAYAAYLTGSSGEVVGIDIRDDAIKLSSHNLLALKARNIEFPEVAAPIRLERHNVFIPLKRHLGRYDAVHVGGALPGSRLGALLDLLGPKGGRIVAPISNELRLVTKSPDGSVRQRVLSQDLLASWLLGNAYVSAAIKGPSQPLASPPSPATGHGLHTPYPSVPKVASIPAPVAAALQAASQRHSNAHSANLCNLRSLGTWMWFWSFFKNRRKWIGMWRCLLPPSHQIWPTWRLQGWICILGSRRP